ncbi:MAG: hypothetical protein AAF990_19175 [Bacteroidota bacterium]
MKQLYWILLVLLVFFVGDRLGGWVLKKLTTDSQFRYSRLYSQRAASDILLVGNSRGLIFYQPYIEERTGKKTFNISYNGMPINLARVLIEDYLEQYEAPELLLLDVSMCDRMNNQLISGFSPYSPYSDRLRQLIVDSIPEVGYGSQLSHLFRYNSEVFQRALYYRNRSDEDWLLDRQINDFMIQNVDKEAALDFDLEPALMEALLRDLKAIVDLAQRKNIDLELMVNPYYPPFAKRFLKFGDWLRKIEATTGLKVRDYSLAIRATEAFGDYQHLNKVGGKQFIDRMIEDGVFESAKTGAIGINR